MPALILRDDHAGSAAHILPELGFNCFHFEVPIGGKPVAALAAEPGFEAGDKRASSSGIPLLFPFPNRIRHGRYRWDGRDYQLPVDKRGNAIHGFVLDRPWRIKEFDEQSATGVFQLSVDAPDRAPFWPADFLIEVRYLVGGTVLRCEIRVVNVDDRPLPWGFGTHPYFHAPLSPESSPADCLIQVPTAQAWELIDCLPTGNKTPVSGRNDLREGQPLGGTHFDDVLTDARPRGGRMESFVIDSRAGLQIVQLADDIFREWVVYTPPGRPSVCIEPYTCVTDAINLQPQGIDAGWRVLPPGAEFRTWIDIGVSRVYA